MFQKGPSREYENLALILVNDSIRINPQVKVTINGEIRELGANVTISVLLETLGYTGRRIAVEVNQAIVPRSLYGQRELAEGDVIEIVQAIGGG